MLGMHNDKNASLGHMVIEDFVLSVVHSSSASAAIHKSGLDGSDN